MEPEFTMVLPSHDLYKDLHGGISKQIPQLTVGRIESYLQQFDKTLDEKCKALYKERYYNPGITTKLNQPTIVVIVDKIKKHKYSITCG